ncbi:MAG TPA: methyltransferase domain-containing protein [Actinomycetota bacterium]
MVSAEQRWRDSLGEWAIPEEILAAAPEEAWSLPVSLFAPPETPADTPSRRSALDRLAGGDVIDVGAGGGSASLSLLPNVSRIVAVDSSAKMLAAFAAAADACGVRHDQIEGVWPEAAPKAGTANVVVCHHVLYNVPDLTPFVRALTTAARRRVVVEITAEHPRARLNPLWERFHGLTRPVRPIADDALAVLREAGIAFEQERFVLPQREQRLPGHERVAFVRRALCLPAERDEEIAAAMREFDFDAPRELVALWWDGTG